MPTPDEILRQQRTATRLDPSGARSTVYQKPAGQVPRGIVTSGVEPMPARAQTIQPPASQIDPTRRAMFEARPTVAPEVSQRMAQRLAPRQMPPGATVQVDPTGTARVNPLNSDAPRSIGQIRGAPTPAAGVGAAGAKIGRLAAPGFIERAVGGLGGAVRGAAGAIGRAAGSLGGLYQISKGVNQMTGDQPGGGWQGAARAALGAAAFVPGPVGTAGRIGSAVFTGADALGVSPFASPFEIGRKATDAAMADDTIREYLNRARGAIGLAPAAGPATPAEPAGGAPGAAPAAATPAAAWFDSPGAIAANVAQPAPRAPAPVGPRGTRTAPAGGPVSRAAAGRLAQLREIAGQELDRQPLAQQTLAERAPIPEIQVYGPGGQPGRPVGPGMTELPAWEGDALRGAPPEGQVQIDRGGGRNIISSFADAQRGGTERVAYAPELTGLAPTELLETIRNSTGSDDPRIAELNRQATELLMTQLREAGALDRTQMQVEGGLAQQQEATRGTLGAADIRARADRETGGQGRVIMGNERRQVGVDAFNQPIYETFSVPYDRFTGERIGEQKAQPQSKVSPDEYRGAVERLMAKKGYSRDDAVAYLKQQGIDAPR